MLNFLKDTWNTVKNLFNFAVHSVQSIFVLISNIPRLVNWLSGILAEIPTIYISIMLVTITISIVFLIINRGGK